MNIDDWTKIFCDLVAKALSEWGNKHGNTEISMLAVDCHPWNGFLELSLLTKNEVEEDELLFDPEEMADWHFFQFSSNCKAWGPAKKLAKRMQSDYEASQNKPETAKKYYISCVNAIKSSEVKMELTKLKMTENFKLSVANPDSGEEYFN